MNLGLGDRIVRLIGGCGVVVFDYFFKRSMGNHLPNRRLRDRGELQ